MCDSLNEHIKCSQCTSELYNLINSIYIQLTLEFMKCNLQCVPKKVFVFFSRGHNFTIGTVTSIKCALSEGAFS